MDQGLNNDVVNSEPITEPVVQEPVTLVEKIAKKLKQKRAATPYHFNGNVVCAIDTETSGVTPGKSDLLEIAIVPLDTHYMVSNELKIFSMVLKPKFPDLINDEAEKVNKGLFMRAMTTGLDPYTAADRFDEWFKELPIAPGKKIVPLGCNYAFDRDMIRYWLGGYLNYDFYFDSRYRDVQLACCFINDQCEMASARIPFPKVNLAYLCSQLRITNRAPHTALGDAVASAEVYSRIVTKLDYAQYAV